VRCLDRRDRNQHQQRLDRLELVFVLIGAAAAMLLAVAVGRGTTRSGIPETNGVAAGLLSLGTSEQSLAGGSAADPTWIIEQRTPTDADLARAIGLETRTQESE
jgi:hypothetical protein